MEEMDEIEVIKELEDTWRVRSEKTDS